jgi:hypothetical protein
MGRTTRGGPYRTHNEPTAAAAPRNKSPPLKKTKRKETLENLSINHFGTPSTPNEKKSSSESNDRFTFLGN